MTEKAIAHYHRHARAFFDQYSEVEPHEVHDSWRLLLRDLEPGRALDIGAGMGRDALWLAQQGWQVTAIEPARALRELGEEYTREIVTWLDARLPDLQEIPPDLPHFDLILLSAVWMHLSPTDRPGCFRRLLDFLAPGGHLVITLRHGPEDLELPMYEVSVAELQELAGQYGLTFKATETGQAPDQSQHPEISWTTVVLRRT